MGQRRTACSGSRALPLALIRRTLICMSRRSPPCSSTGVLVTAGSLINGTTITLYAAIEHNELEFFHIKLAHHNAIYAEGVPYETLRNFDESAVNFAEYLRRYGPPTTEEAPCAPLLSCTGTRREIKSRLRSAISPWIDRRQKIDIIREELEERRIAV